MGVVNTVGGMAMNAFGFGQPSKISPDNQLPNGNGNGNNGGQNDDDDVNGGQSQNGNGNGGQQNQEDDNWLKMTFGSQEDESDFDIPDGMLGGKKNNEQGDGTGQNQGGGDGTGDDPMVQLQESMKSKLADHAIKLEDIPDDIDITDRRQLHKLLNAVQRNMVSAAMSVFSLPMQEALNQLETRVNDSMVSNTTKNNAKQKALAAFEPIKMALRDQKDPSRVNFARSTFQQALSATQDPLKAQKATIQAVQGLFGIAINTRSGSNRGGGDEGDNGSSYKSGAEALDNIFDM